MKYLKITGCSDSLMWYANLVGKCAPFLRQYDDCYMSRDNGGFANIIKLQDAVIVECCTSDCNQGRDCPLR